MDDKIDNLILMVSTLKAIMDKQYTQYKPQRQTYDKCSHWFRDRSFRRDRTSYRDKHRARKVKSYRQNYRDSLQDNYRDDYRRGNNQETQNYKQKHRSGHRDNYRDMYEDRYVDNYKDDYKDRCRDKYKGKYEDTYIDDYRNTYKASYKELCKDKYRDNYRNDSFDKDRRHRSREKCYSGHSRRDDSSSSRSKTISSSKSKNRCSKLVQLETGLGVKMTILPKTVPITKKENYHHCIITKNIYR